METIVDQNVFPVKIYATIDDPPPGLRRFEPLFEAGTPCFLCGTGERRVVLFHGNAQSVTGLDTFALAQSVSRACDATVALVEYPGFWKDSSNTPKTVRGMYSACMTAVRVLSNHFQGPVHVFGYSVGTAPAARVCADLSEHVSSLTLIAPMVSAMSILEDHMPGLRLVSIFARPFDTLCVRRDAMRTKNKRVLVVHGEKDALIKPRHGREVTSVYKRANVAEFVGVEDADHEAIVTREELFAALKAHVGGI